MSVRVGRIMRHEDVHGVSGEGDHKADVFECSDGTCIVRWLGKDGSTNVYAGVKNATNVHGHGGKTEIEWIWEQEPDKDPMEAVFEKKIVEAGGSTGSSDGSTAATGGSGGTGAKVSGGDADEEHEAIAEEVAAEAEEAIEAAADAVAGKMKDKLKQRIAEKVTAEESEDETQTAEGTNEDAPKQE